ncbi:hypothetical protein MSPP1_001922 [Malassezia sp. CBS 17886]|nr:hypothetical protein MSPP1_001922 [Malassezia sp. CBS 17886]
MLATVSPVRPPTGVVLMNMGGPGTLDEVDPFLTRLFLDTDLMRLPFQKRVAPLIARRRTPKVRDQYDQIGGGSPILRWTRTQGAAMASMLDELSPSTAPHKAYVAFRYAAPLTHEMLDELAADGVQRAVAFSQYPQYSCSTSGSSLNELYREMLRRREAGAPEGNIEWSIVDRWATHPGLVHAFANRITEALARFPVEIRAHVPIMFSAHSLPMQVVSGRGDPYPSEVAATAAAVMQRLGWQNPYRVTWQSQVGPSAWLGPQTSTTLKGWAKQGHRNVLVVPIAFTSDHIETLFELDIELQEEAHELGVRLERAESLNDEPVFLRALADIVADHLEVAEEDSFRRNGATYIGDEGDVPWAQGRASHQMGLRCPGCVNDTCAKQRAYFLDAKV